MAGPWDDYAAPAVSPPEQAQGPWSGYQRALDPVPAPESEDSGDFVRGFKRTLPELKQLAGGSLAAVGDVTGLEGVRDYGLGVYQRGREAAESLSKPTDSATEAWSRVTEGDLGAGVDFLQNAAGYTAGQAVQSLAAAAAGAALGSEVPVAGNIAGAVGGLVAKGALKKAAIEAGEKVLAKQIEKGVARGAAEKAASAATRKVVQRAGGAALGAGAYNTMMEVGSVYPEAMEQAEADGREFGTGDKVRALGSALAAAGVESAADLFNLGSLFRGVKDVARAGGKQGVKEVLAAFGRRAAREVPEGMLREAGTEAVQTGLERFGAQQSLNDADAWRDYIDSAAVGAVGGGLFGTAAATRPRPESSAGRKLDPQPQQEEAPEFGADPGDELRAAVLQAKTPREFDRAHSKLVDYLAKNGRLIDGPPTVVGPDGTAVLPADQPPTEPTVTAPVEISHPSRGLTRDVNLAQGRHPGFTGYSPTLPGLALPDPANGPLSRAVNAGAANSALARAAESQAMAAEEQAQVPLERDAKVRPDEVMPAPPPNMDPETGEVVPWNPEQIRAYLVEQASRGSLPKGAAIAQAFGINPRAASEMRRQILVDRRTQLEAEAAQKKAQRNGATTGRTEPAGAAVDGSLGDGGRGGDAAALQDAAVASAAPAPGLFDAASAGIAAARAGAGENAGEGAVAGPLTYDESDELLDADIGAPSGGPFTIEDAAQREAARTEGGRVVPVDGGFVVRTPRSTATADTGPKSQAAPAAASHLGNAAEPTTSLKEGPNAPRTAAAPADQAAASTVGSADHSPTGAPASQPASGGGQGTGASPQSTPATDIARKRAPLNVRMGGQEYPVASIEEASKRFLELRDTVGDIGGMRAIELVDEGGNAVGYIGHNGEVYEGNRLAARAGAEPIYDPKAPRRYGADEVEGKVTPARPSLGNTVQDVVSAWKAQRPHGPTGPETAVARVPGMEGEFQWGPDGDLQKRQHDRSGTPFMVKASRQETDAVLEAIEKGQAEIRTIGTSSPFANRSGAGRVLHQATGRALQAPTAQPRPTRSGTRQVEPGELVTTRDVYGNTVRVRQADLDGDRTLLPMYTAQGKLKTGKNGAIHRENLDPDGSKAREIPGLPYYARTTAKGERPFKTEKAARTAVARAGQPAEAYEIEARGGGFIAVRKAAPAPTVETAAHAAATSPKNDLPAPTEAQKEAGNYAKGHTRIAGLDITIENPAGSRRRPEWPPLAHHYGYFRGTIGKDKDHVDVFLTDNAADMERPVFVVDQRNRDGKFDEHKVVLGAATVAEARKAYLANYSKGWTGLGAITQMTMDQFKAWVHDEKMTKRPASRSRIGLTYGPGRKAEAEVGAVAQAKLREAAETVTLPGRQARGVPAAEISVVQDGAVWRYRANWSTGTSGAGGPFGTETFDSRAEARAAAIESIATALPKNPAGAEQAQIERIRTWLDEQRGPTPPAKTPSPRPRAKPKNTVAEKEAPPQANEKIEDFGERLEGARKFLPPSLKEELGDDQIANLPLSKIWPADAHQGIEDARAAALAFAARAEIPPKPRKSYKVRRWVEQVKQVRALMQASETELAGLEVKAQELGLQLQGFFAKARLLAQLPRESWGRVERVGEYPNAFGYEEGARVSKPFSSVTIDGTTHQFDVGAIGPDEVQQIKVLLAGQAPKKTGLVAADFEIRRNRKTGLVFINRKGDSERRHLHEFTGDDATKDARAYLREQANVDALAGEWEKVKARDNVGKGDLRRDVNSERVGENRRNGKDVTEQMFADAFGFRGVQFGNWVGQGKGAKNRQGMLNEAYDALLDLADVLGIPPRAISLDGSLGLALGARGAGKASAHFERDNLVINLTKTRGAGSLAHEWFHALDNYFSRLRGTDSDNARTAGYITYRPEPAWVFRPTGPISTRGGSSGPSTGLRTGFTSAALQQMLERSGNWDANKSLAENAAAAGWVRDPNHKQGVRPVVEKAFADLVAALNASPMAARAAVLDKGAADGYWSRIIERGARSFENYVISKMAERGWTNDFLANIRDFQEWEAIGKNRERYPYLRPEEEGPIVAAFDGLFGTIESREADGGNVALFSRTSRSEASALAGLKAGRDNRTLPADRVRAIAAATFARWRGAPKLEVHEQDPGGDAQGAEGWYDDRTGTVHLVAANLRGGFDPVLRRQVSAADRIRMVAIHEAIGHHGIENITGANLWSQLEQTIDRMRASGRHAELFRSIDRRYAGANRSIATREAIAVMAEKGIRNSVIDRVVAALRRFLRDVAGLSLRFSEAELRQHIVAAARYVRDGARPRAGAVPAGAFASRPELDMKREVPVVEVAGGLFGDTSRNPAEARRLARNHLRRLRDSGLAMTNDDRGWKIELSGKSIGELVSWAPDKLNLLGALPRITKVAVWADSRPNMTPSEKNPSGDSVLAYHDFYAPVRLNGELRIARLVVQEQKGGRYAYDLQQSEVLKNESPVEPARDPGNVRGATQAQTRPVMTVAQIRDAVNAVDRPGWSMSRPDLRIATDGRGQRSIEMGGERFIERAGRFYMEDGKGQPRDFHSLSDARAAADRTGGEVLVDDAVEGERPSWSVVVRGVDQRAADAGTPMFSKPDPAAVLEDVEAVMAAGGDKSMLARAREFISDATPQRIKDQLRGTWLGALTTRHLTELGADHLENIKLYSDYLATMGADRNKLQAEAEGVAESARKWAGKNRAEAKRLFKLMHDATVEGVDPAKSFQPLQFRYAGQLLEATPKNVKEALKALRQQMLERSGDNKKDMMAEAKAIRGMPARDKRRKMVHAPLSARWRQLSPEAQEVYRQFRDMYAKRSDQVEQGLIDRINDTDAPENHKRKLVTVIRQQFETARLQGVYFPLQRFGRYFVAAEKDGTPTFLMFERLSQLERAVKDLRTRGFTIKAQGLKQESKAKDAPSGSFVAEIMEALNKAGVSDKTQDDIYQIYLQALPELSMRKHAIHRQSVPGFDPDAIRAFAFNMHHGSHQLARLRYAHKLEDVLTLLAGQQDRARREEGADTRKIAAGDAIIDELRRRHQWIMSPTDSQLTNLVSSAGFTYYLGLTPAAALVNLTQTGLVSYPYLAARFGGVKAMNALLAGLRDAAGTLGNIQKRLKDPEELRAHQALQDMGALDKTQAHNLAGIAEGGLTGYNPAWSKAMEIVGWGFHKTEVVNREATGIAAFRLARAAGQSFESAVRVAADTINDTHFDYTNANRARFMQSGVAKTLLMFRQYSLNMTWHLGRMVWQATKGQTPEVKKLARRNLAGILGMSALFSGTLGLPMMSMAMGVLNAIAASFGDDDDPWDAETELRAYLSDMLGAGAAELLLNGGANQLTGADIASRVGLSDLWFRDADRELDGRGAYYHLLEQAAGPMGGVLKNALVGKSLIDEGHVMRGVETMLPKSLKDMVKASRYATEGVNTLRGDPLVEDVGVWRTLLQLSGFTPSKVAEQYDQNRALKNYEQYIIDRRQRLMDGYAMALREGDAGDQAQVLERIGRFNRANPELAITQKSIHASLRSRARYSADAEAGITLNRKLAGRLRERVGVGD